MKVSFSTAAQRGRLRNLRNELVQTAAVTIAIIEDMDRGSADLLGIPGIIDELLDERVSQNGKWGAQHHSLTDWMSILMEEVGEAAKEVVEYRGIGGQG